MVAPPVMTMSVGQAACLDLLPSSRLVGGLALNCLGRLSLGSRHSLLWRRVIPK